MQRVLVCLLVMSLFPAMVSAQEEAAPHTTRVIFAEVTFLEAPGLGLVLALDTDPVQKGVFEQVFIVHDPTSLGAMELPPLPLQAMVVSSQRGLVVLPVGARPAMLFLGQHGSLGHPHSSAPDWLRAFTTARDGEQATFRGAWISHSIGRWSLERQLGSGSLQALIDSYLEELALTRFLVKRDPSPGIGGEDCNLTCESGGISSSCEVECFFGDIPTCGCELIGGGFHAVCYCIPNIFD